jgi:hypothetical protein
MEKEDDARKRGHIHYCLNASLRLYYKSVYAACVCVSARSNKKKGTESCIKRMHCKTTYNLTKILLLKREKKK